MEKVKYKKIEYNNETIAYELKKLKIKNMYIYIKEGKVIVKAPIRIEDEKIYDFVNKKAKWIYDNLKKQKQKMEEKQETEIKEKDIKKLEIIVKESIEKYSKLLKAKPQKVTIKDMKYAWGSCSSNKNISINLKLATKDEKTIEYVVLHEMSHLKYMNHSKNFWELVGQYMPEYKEYRKMLKEE